jgi:hypothetical protein
MQLREGCFGPLSGGRINVIFDTMVALNPRQSEMLHRWIAEVPGRQATATAQAVASLPGAQRAQFPAARCRFQEI